MRVIVLAASIALLLGSTVAIADTTTTTTTTTNADGSTTVVEETTTTETGSAQVDTHQPKLVGPTGATGTIRRSNRRQNRRGGDAHIN